MNIDAYSFLTLGVSGFMTVWTFRKLTKQKEKLGEFEYLGLSTFWGMIIIFTALLIPKTNPENFYKAFNNPFAVGFVFSCFGIIMAILGAELFWIGLLISKTKFFMRLKKKFSR